MRLLNLFDGIGGFGLAAKWMGWENVASCEIDPYCRRVLDYWFDYKYIYMTTSRQLTLPLFVDTSTSLPGDSPASRSASPASNSVKRTAATCGRTCLELFGRFGRVGSWRKTFAACLLNLTGWSSSRCALAWKLRATKYNRLYFLLQASALPTAATGSGLLPTAQTPNAMEIVEDPKKFVQRNGDRTEKSMPNLSSMAKYGMLITPSASEEKRATFSMESLRKNKESGNLTQQIAHMLIPTPTGNDYKNNTFPESQEKKKGYVSVVKEIMKQGQVLKDSRLNPLFVGEMMGYPEDWLVLPFQRG